MDYQATAKYIHVSTRKVRLVAGGIRKLTPSKALLVLNELPNHAAVSLGKIIESALNNAKQKDAKDDLLRFKLIDVMGGPVMKRWHAVSRGQAHGYKKRMTHIRVVLTDTPEVNEAREVKGGSQMKT